MAPDPITEEVRRYYDAFGAGYRLAERWEGRAVSRGMEMLELRPGMRVLDIGVGGGINHRRMIQQVEPGGLVVGADIAPHLLRLARDYTGAPMVQADARALPFGAASFDRVFCSYVLELLPAGLDDALAGVRRVLRPGGRLAVVNVTEGVSGPSRAFIAAWRAAYRIHPLVCGGNRPFVAREHIERAGFTVCAHEVHVQVFVPSEVTLAQR